MTRSTAAAVLLPALVFTVYVASPLKVQTDSMWSIPTAASILHEHNTDLDEFAAALTRRKSYAIIEVQGRHYNFFPLGASLAALPFLWAFDHAVAAVAPLAKRFPRLQRALKPWQDHFDATGDVDIGWFDVTEMLIASALVSLAALLVFLTARRALDVGPAALLAVLFALGTSAYSIASRVLWQHSPSILAVSGAVFLLTAPRRSRAQSFALGAVVALAYVARPTNSLTVLFVTLFLVLWHRREVPLYLTGAACVAAPFCAFNLSLYGALLPPYFVANRLAAGHFLEAMAGNLVSAGRGLFVYTPVALFAVASALARLRRGELRDHEALFLCILTAHWAAVSCFPHWWAGHSFGPRFFTDVLPYLAYFLQPWAGRACSRKTVLRGSMPAFLAAALLSLFIHFRGSTAVATWHWNDSPRNVDVQPSRLWDYSDLAFLRGG